MTTSFRTSSLDSRLHWRGEQMPSPSSLDNMIESVLKRIAKKKDLGNNIVRKMLLCVIYAPRPLPFQELDLFLRLRHGSPNLLL